MSNVGTIDLELSTNTSPFQRELDGIAGQATNMVGGAFMKLGGIIAAAFAVDKLTEFGRSSIELASNLQEVQNVVDVTFGSMAQQVNDFSKTAITKFGISELSAKKFASTMGAMLKSSGLSGQQMTNMSLGIAGLSADMASFYNLKPQEAFDKIRSGISGETEPLKELGVNMSVANMEAYALSQGITTSYAKMNQASQSLLRYNYLLSVTKDAQGDFARTSGSWANQTRLLSEQWNIMKTTMGQGFINALTPLLSVINKIIARLQVAAQYFKAFTEMIFGNAVAVATGEQAGAAIVGANATDKLGNSADTTAGKVKKAAAAIKGSLGAFDQLNVLGQKKGSDDSDDSSLGGLGAGGADVSSLGAVPPIDTSSLDSFKEKVKSTTDAVKAFFQNVRTFIEEHKAGVTSAIAGIIGAFAAFAIITNWAAIVEGFVLALEGIGAAVAFIFSPAVLVAAAIGLIIAAIADLWQTDEEFRASVKEVWTDIKNFTTKIVSDTWGIIKQTWDKYGKDILKGLQGFWDNTKAIIKSAWENVIKPIIENSLKTMQDLWDKHLKGLVAAIADFVAKVVADALEIYNGFIAPLVKWIIENIGPAFVKTFKLAGDIIGTFLGVAIDIATGVIKALGGIIDFITGVFTGNWSKAWQGIKEIFGGVFDALRALAAPGINAVLGVIESFVNLAIKAFNKLIYGWNLAKSAMGISGWTMPIEEIHIPRLANGGLVSQPTLAMVGDNRNASQDPEVVAPLSKLQGMLGGDTKELVEVMKQVLSAIQNQSMSLKIGESEFARLVGKCVNDEQRRTGRTLIQV